MVEVDDGGWRVGRGIPFSRLHGTSWASGVMTNLRWTWMNLDRIWQNMSWGRNIDAETHILSFCNLLHQTLEIILCTPMSCPMLLSHGASASPLAVTHLLLPFRRSLLHLKIPHSWVSPGVDGTRDELNQMKGNHFHNIYTYTYTYTLYPHYTYRYMAYIYIYIKYH